MPQFFRFLVRLGVSTFNDVVLPKKEISSKTLRIHPIPRRYPFNNEESFQGCIIGKSWGKSLQIGLNFSNSSPQSFRLINDAAFSPGFMGENKSLWEKILVWQKWRKNFFSRYFSKDDFIIRDWLHVSFYILACRIQLIMFSFTKKNLQFLWSHISMKIQFIFTSRSSAAMIWKLKRWKIFDFHFFVFFVFPFMLRITLQHKTFLLSQDVAGFLRKNLAIYIHHYRALELF